jgi:hypothetical protein
MTRPYRGLSVQDVDVPLTSIDLMPFLLGREVYRRTDYLALRNGGQTAIVAVRKASTEPLFSPIVEARVLAGPEEVVSITAPETDVGNASALARTALAQHRVGVRAYVVQGRFEHVNFIWDPAPIRIRVTEVVPPEPPKLFVMAEQVVAFDEDLPPIELVLDAVDIRKLSAANPAPRYLLPCRGSGVDLGGEVSFLDTRPSERLDWLMIGCERSLQFHRHFYGDEPPRVDICPRQRVDASDLGPRLGSTPAPIGTPTLTKCCLIERGVEYSETAAVVPWGSNLDEVRWAIRRLTGVDSADDAADDHDEEARITDLAPSTVR